ncbi:hypothetical protein [Halalkalicoccus sp. NIPERK01]|uniref:hypothetical protein n=1 Tax=Halalkalicoccus sp. NIPERK01 TaxID=3053469 RepID=UPI00256F5D97|nr:hypothetical protein [Halalkalicoccus sp. NIPERK01]MDL5363847.1 hypothetical protein [Halalkalicoccus sp. NIPERK01]
MATAIEGKAQSGRNRVLVFVEILAVTLFLAYFMNLLLVTQLGMESLFSNVHQYLLLLIMSFLIAGDIIAKKILA